MNAPIFVVCSNGDLLAFRSVEAAQAAMESPDVESGEYAAAFDAEGQLLAIEVQEPTRRKKLLGVTSIVLTPVVLRPTGETQVERLRTLLHEQIDTDEEPLSVLVSRAFDKLSR